MRVRLPLVVGSLMACVAALLLVSNGDPAPIRPPRMADDISPSAEDAAVTGELTLKIRGASVDGGEDSAAERQEATSSYDMPSTRHDTIGVAQLLPPPESLRGRLELLRRIAKQRGYRLPRSRDFLLPARVWRVVQELLDNRFDMIQQLEHQKSEIGMRLVEERMGSGMVTPLPLPLPSLPESEQKRRRDAIRAAKREAAKNDSDNLVFVGGNAAGMFVVRLSKSDDRQLRLVVGAIERRYDELLGELAVIVSPWVSISEERKGR